MKDKILHELKSFLQTFVATFAVDYSFILEDLYAGNIESVTWKSILIASIRTGVKAIMIMTAKYFPIIKKDNKK